MDKAMVAISVPKKTAEQLAVVGGEPAERMHITLAFFEHPPADPDEVLEVLAAVAARHPKLKANLSGIGRFESTDAGEDAVVALVDAPGLGALRTDLVDSLIKAGVAPTQNHDFTPHITIARIGFHEQLPVRRIGELDMRVGAMDYVHGDKRVGRMPLTGEKVAKTEQPALESENLVEVRFEFPISKTKQEQRLVYGIVLEPDEIDAHNDTIDEAGIQMWTLLRVILHQWTLRWVRSLSKRVHGSLL
jgi:2'-5' RNA ligase